MKVASLFSRGRDDQRGASGPISVTPWWRRDLLCCLEGQERMACSKVAPGGCHPHTPYISCPQLLVGWTATTYTVLWERSYGSHCTRKHTTTQPYSAVAPYPRWGRRGVLGISPESYRRFGPLLLRQ